MPTITVPPPHFWLDEEPLPVQAGEFHYFRTPATAWEQRLTLLLEAGFNAVATYIPWLWHQPAPDVLDLTGETHPLRDLAGFIDLAQRMGLYVIARPGPYIMAETINEGIPPWVLERYPQVALINQRGERENIVAYLHPDFLRCVADWYRAVFAVLAPRQVTRGGPIVLVQLDNEMGMMHWVRNSFDLNPVTLAHFADWLEHADAAEQPVSLPPADAEALAEGLRRGDPDLVKAYRRFFRTYLRDYAVWLMEKARANGLEVPPVINIHGFANGGKTFPIGLSQLVEVLRLPGVISAMDMYPGQLGEGNFHQILLINAMTRAVQDPQQPLFSIEFQAGGNLDFSNMSSAFYDLHTRLCLSTGMSAFNHYLFFDGENDPLLSPVKRHDWGHPVRKDGTVRSHYHRYAPLMREIKAAGLTVALPKTVTTVGFCLDDFMTEVNSPATQEATAIITHQREVVLFDFIARGLALTHRAFDAVDLQRGDLDPHQMPVLWAMLDLNCAVATEERLLAYLRAGGRLVAIGRLRPEGALAAALGVTIQTDAPFVPRRVQVFATPDIPATMVQTYAGDFAEVFATCDGAVVGFRQRVGDGDIIMLGAAFPIIALEDLDAFEHLAALAGVEAPFCLTAWADVRIDSEERLLFINNYRDDPLETVITYCGQPLLDGRPVRLPARSGAILPLAGKVADGASAAVAVNVAAD